MSLPAAAAGLESTDKRHTEAKNVVVVCMHSIEFGWLHSHMFWLSVLCPDVCHKLTAAFQEICIE